MQSPPDRLGPKLTPGRVWPHFVAPLWLALNLFYFSSPSRVQGEMFLFPSGGTCVIAFLINPIVLAALGVHGGRHPDTIGHALYAAVFTGLVVLWPIWSRFDRLSLSGAIDALILTLMSLGFWVLFLICLVVYAIGFGIGRAVARNSLGR
jgi:hypothetical protein